jgi:hypothetical protein
MLKRTAELFFHRLFSIQSEKAACTVCAQGYDEQTISSLIDVFKFKPAVS